MFWSGLVNRLVTNANIKGFGLTPLSGDRRGYMPPLLKTKQETMMKKYLGWSLYFSGVCRKTMLLLIGFPWKKISSVKSSDHEFLHSLSDDEDDDDDSCFRVISNFRHFDPKVKTFFFCSSKDSFLGWRHKRGSKSNIPPMVSRNKATKI